MPFHIELISLSLRVRYISPGKQCCQGPALEGNGFKHLVQFQTWKSSILMRKWNQMIFSFVSLKAMRHFSTSDNGLVTLNDTCSLYFALAAVSSEQQTWAWRKGASLRCTVKDSLSQQWGQGYREPQMTVNFHFNWSWHIVNDFLHNISIFLIIILINLIIGWANI